MKGILVVIVLTLGLVVGVASLSQEAGVSAQENCHASYVGQCLEFGIGDYDCEGGGGDGPNYVTGQVEVVGRDEFDLDRDGDGVGCESLAPGAPAAPDPVPDGSTQPSAPPHAGFGPDASVGGIQTTWLMVSSIVLGLAALAVMAGRVAATRSPEHSLEPSCGPSPFSLRPSSGRSISFAADGLPDFVTPPRFRRRT